MLRAGSGAAILGAYQSACHAPCGVFFTAYGQLLRLLPLPALTGADSGHRGRGVGGAGGGYLAGFGLWGEGRLVRGGGVGAGVVFVGEAGFGGGGGGVSGQGGGARRGGLCTWGGARAVRGHHREAGALPRTRGAGLRELTGLATAGVTPAHAGSSTPCGSANPWRWGHPRTRGEQSRGGCGAGAGSGSPPHTRGAALSSQHGVRERGVTPAHAGSRGVGRHRPDVPRGHPRGAGYVTRDFTVAGHEFQQLSSIQAFRTWERQQPRHTTRRAWCRPSRIALPSPPTKDSSAKPAPPIPDSAELFREGGGRACRRRPRPIRHTAGALGRECRSCANVEACRERSSPD